MGPHLVPEWRICIKCQEKILYSEGGKVMEQVAQRSCEFPIPIGVPGKVGSEMPDYVIGNPVHCKGLKSVSNLTYDSVIVWQ